MSNHVHFTPDRQGNSLGPFDHTKDICPHAQLPNGTEVRIATRRADVVKVLSDTAFSLAQLPPSAAITGTTFQGPHGLLRLDRPYITERKRALNNPTAAHGSEADSVARYGDIAAKTAADFGNNILTRKGLDRPTLNEFTRRFVNAATAEALGTSFDTASRINDFVAPSALSLVYRGGLPSTRHNIIVRGWTRTYEICSKLINEKETTPDDSLLTKWIHSLKKSGANNDEVLQSVASMVNGFSTIGSIMNICIIKLMQQPKLVRTCLEDPSQWEAAINDILREQAHFTTALPRIATKSVVLPTGTHIQKGEIVLPSIHAALQDPESKEKVRQSGRQAIVFGAGPHRCPAEKLSNLWLQSGIEALFRELPGLHMPLGANVWAEGNPPTPLGVIVAERQPTVIDKGRRLAKLILKRAK